MGKPKETKTNSSIEHRKMPTQPTFAYMQHRNSPNFNYHINVGNVGKFKSSNGKWENQKEQKTNSSIEHRKMPTQPTFSSLHSLPNSILIMYIQHKSTFFMNTNHWVRLQE
jgi:hypothetical protein